MASKVNPAIPVSQIVGVIPSVLGVGGTALNLNGLFLTQNTRVPIGQILQFSDAADVSSYFGPLTQEAALGTIYFNGFDNSTAKPGTLYFYQYAANPVGAYLRGGSLATMTLSGLQALNGTLSVTIDGVVKSGSVNFAGATSFSNAAQQISAVLNIPGAGSVANFTATIAGTVMTVDTVTSGTLSVNQLVSGTSVAIGTYIVSEGTGTGTTGTYNLSQTNTVSSAEAMTATPPGVTYDSQSAAFVVASASTGTASTITYGTGGVASSLLLTAATGAVLSPGAEATTPTAAMAAILDITQNWATFLTLWEPADNDKISFGTWTAQQLNRYVYLMVDTNAQNITSAGPSTAAASIIASADSGVCLIYEDPTIDTTGEEIAAFVSGAIASIDFTATNGRTNLSFRSQSGLAPQIKSGSSATNLMANSFNFYGNYTDADEAFTFFYPGTILGDFKWIDSYVNQIWLNSALQSALINLLVSVFSLPYNQQGYSMIEASLLDPINAAVNFGAIRPGITLSQAQIAEVNSAAGRKIDDVLSAQGWYLLIQNASAATRALKQSPPMKLWYMDGEDIQMLQLGSIEVQ